MPHRSSPWWGGVLALVVTACGGDERETPADSCPPEPPFGTEEGLVAPDASLYDCDGAAVQLRDTCPRQGALIYAFAGW